MKRVFCSAVFLGLFFYHTSMVSASACVPDRGEWKRWDAAPSDYERSGVQSLSFQAAEKMNTARGDVRRDSKDEMLDSHYEIQRSLQNGLWVFRFLKNGAEKGSWFLTPLDKWSFFQTDLGDSAYSQPILYKETVLLFSASGNGLFASDSVAGVRARLILQGQGSGCWESGQFQRWILQIEGPDPERAGEQTIYYSFIGSLGDPRQTGQKPFAPRLVPQ